MDARESCMTSCRMSPICVPALSASISLTACIHNTPPFLLSLTEPKQSAARAASGTSHLRNPCRADQACTGHGCLCPSTSTYSNVQTHECMRACMHACMHARQRSCQRALLLGVGFDRSWEVCSYSGASILLRLLHSVMPCVHNQNVPSGEAY